MQTRSESPILVVGGTGRVGTAVTLGLLRAGLRARVLVRTPARAQPLVAAGAEPVAGDLRQPGSLPAALQGVTRAFLACADAPDQEQLECNFVAAARQAGVRHVVKLSAQSAGLSVPVSFGAVHRRIERVLEQSGMGFTLLRPTFFQQSLLLFATDVRRRGAFAAPARHARIAMVDCRDVADVAVHCLQRPAAFGPVLTLTGPEAHSLPGLAALLSELRGRPVRYSALPAWVAQLLLPFASGMPRWQSNQVVALFRALERGAQAEPSSDVQRVLGRPARRVEDFLAEHAEAFGVAAPAAPSVTPG